jgi:hypothetical protein
MFGLSNRAQDFVEDLSEWFGEGQQYGKTPNVAID